jgi:hypothetical protein
MLIRTPHTTVARIVLLSKLLATSSTGRTSDPSCRVCLPRPRSSCAISAGNHSALDKSFLQYMLETRSRVLAVSAVHVISTLMSASCVYKSPLRCLTYNRTSMQEKT